ncbi:MAG: HIT domain-containing protein [Candidatus Blackburnbacteria bacterium]|nr:HIT domain-containing protein [Candidatus Blackburnbacteria bacterium]
MKDCLFCKIVAGVVPSEKEYEDEDILIFRDIHPKAPIHLLIIPKKHIEQFADLVDDTWEVWLKMNKTAQEFIEDMELRKTGYRLVVNGAGAALIQHLHLHLLGDIEHTRDI